MRPATFAALALLAATMAPVTPSLARDAYPPMINGQKLLDYCNAREQHRRFSCGYYIMGAIDFLVNNERLLRPGDESKFAVCPPAGKTPEELVTVVKHYIEKQADKTQPGYELTFAAMREAFPCK
jgi:hypothetical protein